MTHIHRDPERGKGSGRLLRGDPRPLANRRMGLPELVDRRRLERAARKALDDAGWMAPTVVVAATLAGQDLKSKEIKAALEIVGELRGQHDRPPTEEEIAMAVTEATKQTRDALLALLREDPTLTNRQLWEQCKRRDVKLTAFTSFEGHHCPWARKELGIDASERSKKRKAKRPSPAPRPAIEHSTTTEPARQPSEEASPPETPAPPPAAPVATDTGPDTSAADWTPAGVKIVRERLEAELLGAQQRVREIRIALEVVEGLVA